MKNEPLIITGLGGSGTRALVEILDILDFDFGYDLNRASDNLLFTLLFKLPNHFYKSFDKDSSYIKSLIILNEKLHKSEKLNLIDMQTILKLCLMHAFGFKYYSIGWIYYRIRAINNSTPRKSEFWGWKEPHVGFFISDFQEYYKNGKFIFLIRNGLDMAYSKNDQQFRNYGFYFGLDAKCNTPKNRFEFWYRFNEYVLRILSKKGYNNYKVVYFEKLIKESKESMSEICEFLNIEIGDTVLKNAVEKIKNKGTIGRFKEKDISWVDYDVKVKLSEIGYNYDELQLDIIIYGLINKISEDIINLKQ